MLNEVRLAIQLHCPTSRIVFVLEQLPVVLARFLQCMLTLPPTSALHPLPHPSFTSLSRCKILARRRRAAGASICRHCTMGKQLHA